MRQVAKDLVALHPGGGLTVEELMSKARFEADGCTLKKWHLGHMGLTALPESLGDLTLSGSLRLYYNKISTLPESFASVTVGGRLDLRGNRLTTFPKSFPNVKGKVKK